MKKNLRFLLIIAIFYIGLIPNVSALTGEGLEKDNNEEYLKRNWELIQLSTKVQNKIKEYYKIEKEYEDKYPDYYGGIYMNDDATSLVIQIVKKYVPDEKDSEYNIYKEIVEMDNKIKIEYVDYSFNELNAVNNNVSDYMALMDLNNDNVRGTYIDIMKNKIVVEVKENNDKEQKKIKNNIAMGKNNIISKLVESSKIFIFKEAGITSITKNIITGSKIYGDNSCTIGPRIYYNGSGYLTAGHCVKNLKYTPKGTVIKSVYSNGGRYDYAYVHITDNQTNLTNTLEKSSSDGKVTKLAVVDYCPSITTNMAIAKVGAVTGYTSGKVTGLNQTVTNDDDITIHGLVKSNVKTDKGDSGGPVFIPRTDSQGGAIAIGIVNMKETTTILGIFVASYFTNIYDLPSYLQNRY